MRYQDIVGGEEYGLRIKVAMGQPLVHVRALERRDRNKQVKVQHLDEPDAGMEEWLPFRHFVVAWKERKHFLPEEAQLERVKQRSNEAFDGSPPMPSSCPGQHRRDWLLGPRPPLHAEGRSGAHALSCRGLGVIEDLRRVRPTGR